MATEAPGSECVMVPKNSWVWRHLAVVVLISMDILCSCSLYNPLLLAVFSLKYLQWNLIWWCIPRKPEMIIADHNKLRTHEFHGFHSSRTNSETYYNTYIKSLQRFQTKCCLTQNFHMDILQPLFKKWFWLSSSNVSHSSDTQQPKGANASHLSSMPTGQVTLGIHHHVVKNCARWVPWLKTCTIEWIFFSSKNSWEATSIT